MHNIQRLFFVLCNLYHNGTFHALSEKLAAIFINSRNIAGGMIGVGSAAAGAIELCPAVLAVRTGIGIAVFEAITHFGVFNTVPHVAHEIFFVAHKLVAGIKVTPRRDRHILGA